ncbi:hypothetical protein IEQ34_020832 [Dendrobium chrysotoxum]|uniref:Uncharacterized protein n=1 Tax=Dendrobium chrysotoxum TaxID=161865 RepID=A0AAV7G319_DENCH|nr:hypothetical protein IEQ34_020832 [Dendrobium chrysotoxum]
MLAPQAICKFHGMCQPWVWSASHTKFLAAKFSRLRACSAAFLRVATVILFASMKLTLEYCNLCFLQSSFTRGTILRRWHLGKRGNKWCST